MFFKAITYILSGLILASAFQPLAICHVHVGGDWAHSHDDENYNHVHGHHHHAHSHPHHEHESDDRSLTPELAHVHFSFMGFVFSLPLPAEEQPNGPFSPQTDMGIVGGFRLGDEITTASRVILPNPFDLALVKLMPSDFDGAVGSRTSLDASRINLRGIARCERSGVLLI